MNVIVNYFIYPILNSVRVSIQILNSNNSNYFYHRPKIYKYPPRQLGNTYTKNLQWAPRSTYHPHVLTYMFSLSAAAFICWLNYREERKDVKTYNSWQPNRSSLTGGFCSMSKLLLEFVRENLLVPTLIKRRELSSKRFALFVHLRIY